MYIHGKKDKDPYNISTMEMGSIWERKKYIKNSANPLSDNMSIEEV